MKPLEFEGNTPSCSFTYTRTREGPNFFVSHYKGSTRGHNDPKDCWRTLGTAKFTDSGKALKEWCLSMDEKYSVQEEDTEEGRKDTSFASEVQAEPNDQTRMVM
ncbi:hypothetical protein N8654_03205 [Synechococcus sp. AH-601-B19]|nr:hypothetical protein [Synechococcus sp. AH-601-B19]